MLENFDMENATARSSPKSSGKSCHHEAGKSQHRPGGHLSRARGGAHSVVQRQIEASAPYQYRLPNDGRKWRVQCACRQELAIYLAGYRACYPGRSVPPVTWGGQGGRSPSIWPI
jgi:hypothetical protein